MFPLTNSFIGKSLSGYRLERQLGRGGTGMVFLGIGLENPESRVAIKILAPAYAISPEDMDALRMRFLREVSTLQMLNNPHIVPIRAFGQTYGGDDTNLSYMILPYLEGGTLTQRMARERLPLPTVARYLTDLADAVDYAHRQGVIHRDIKPANVLLDGNGAVFLSDFGIARLFEQQEHPLTASGQVMGTPEYMSPEQATGREVGAQSDQYSLGIMAYEMATGRVPFRGPTIIDYLTQHAQTPPPAPAAIGADLPEPAAAAIMKALSKVPEQRFATATAFATAFTSGLAGEWDPALAQSDNLTVHKFTPSKTIMVKVEEEQGTQSERITPDKTQAVKLPTEEEIAQRKRVQPAFTKAYGEQLLQDARTKGLPVVQQRTTQVVAYAKANPRNAAIGGAVIAALLIFIIVSRIHPPPPVMTGPSYFVANPGSCDKSTEVRWSVSSNATQNCSSTDGYVLTKSANLQYLANDHFIWNNHPFPQNYTINVTLTNITNACAGFEVRGSNSDASAYAFFVCKDRSVLIYRYDPQSGTPTDMISNTAAVTSDAPFTMQGSVKNNKLILIVNGQTFTATDSTNAFLHTDYVALALYSLDSTQDGFADFSQFRYTPQ